VFGGGARLGERGWGADAHAAEAALCVVCGVTCLDDVTGYRILRFLLLLLTDRELPATGS
jgi:hypothetical protein